MTAHLAELLASASVEISSSGNQLEELAGRFAAGTDVSITFLPGDNYRHNVETAASLRRAGFNPVPHIAAREMPSREALDDFLARLGGEANVARVVLIAGDVAAAKGPFKSSRDVAASGLIEAHGITSVSVAGYPEGHPWLKPVRFHASYRPGHDAWGRQPGEGPVIGVTDYYRVEGDEIHEVAVGPVHAGVIVCVFRQSNRYCDEVGSYTRDCIFPSRAVAFQSMRRRLSPGR